MRIKYATLNEHVEHLPSPTADRLATARKAALARKKPDAPVSLAQRQVAGNIGSLFSFSTLGRMAVIVPLLALVVGLAGIYQYEEDQRIAEMAELDAALLADDLPLTAYLDTGFNAYLEKRAQ